MTQTIAVGEDRGLIFSLAVDVEDVPAFVDVLVEIGADDFVTDGTTEELVGDARDEYEAAVHVANLLAIDEAGGQVDESEWRTINESNRRVAAKARAGETDAALELAMRGVRIA